MSVRIRLSSVYPTLPAAERRVADFILANPCKAVHMIINEIAEEAHVSIPSVTRLARKLGYKGFMEFRVALASSMSNVVPEDDAPLDESDSDEVFIRKLMYSQLHALEATLKTLDCAALASLADAIVGCRRTVWLGVGGAIEAVSGVSEDICRMGVDSIVVSQREIMPSYAEVLKPGDLCIGVSRTGITRSTIESVATAKGNGVRTAFITNFADSPAASIADIFICAARPESLCKFRGFEPYGSINALFEVIVMLVAKKSKHTKSVKEK